MKLNYRKFAAKPPLVIAHGLFGSASNWQTIAKELGEDFSVFSVDMRNHGQSEHHDDMSYHAMAADLIEFVDTHCDGRAALVGHSMGGKAVMTAALLQPAKVDRLIVVDVAPVKYESALGRYAELMSSIPLDQIAHRKDAEAYLLEEIREPGIRAFLLHNLRRDGENRWYWRPNLSVIKRDLPKIADFPDFQSSFDKPALFVGGSRSDYLAEQHWPQTLALFPQAQRKMLAEAGHWVHAEKPDQVTQLIRAMVERLT